MSVCRECNGPVSPGLAAELAGLPDPDPLPSGLCEECLMRAAEERNRARWEARKTGNPDNVMTMTCGAEKSGVIRITLWTEADDFEAAGHDFDMTPRLAWLISKSLRESAYQLRPAAVKAAWADERRHERFSDAYPFASPDDEHDEVTE